LQSVGSKHIARPLGAITDEFVVLGILQEFLLGAAEGWAMATASVRDLMAEGDLHAAEVGGDFAGEAFRLGQAVAEVHADLRKALGSGQEGPERLYGAVQAMHQRLDTVLAEVPELAPYESALRAAFEQARGGPALVEVQFIHGDLHLGQVLAVPNGGWRIVDFEGEPLRPMEERAIPDLPPRDVAGMLRSFAYASAVGGAPDATSWAAACQAAFVDAYAAADGAVELDPVLLQALVLDKAVYESIYEARNRPDWLPVPLAGIDAALS
jgi:maltokinase